MLDKKKELKSEVNKNIRTIVIVALSILLISSGFSLAKILNISNDPKVIWGFDFGIYNAIFSIIVSVITYIVRLRKLFIQVEILHKKEDVNEIKLTEDPEEIYVKIQIQGSYKKILTPLQIKFPHWIDPQSKPKPYLTFNESDNIFLLDLEKLISGSKNIDKSESITIDIISNTDEKNTDLVESQMDIGFIRKWFSIDFENKGIKIKRKWGSFIWRFLGGLIILKEVLMK